MSTSQYPQIGTFAGLQGVITYALAGSLPILTFPYLASRIRKICPHGFVLTEFVRERFGTYAAIFLSIFTCLTLVGFAPANSVRSTLITYPQFIYMVSELTSVSAAVNALTGLSGLPATIVEVVITLIYTAVGGLRTSMITDNIQGVMIILLLIICSVAVGAKTEIDRSLIGPSQLLDASLLGWKLLYILPVAIVFNCYFLSGCGHLKFLLFQRS